MDIDDIARIDRSPEIHGKPPVLEIGMAEIDGLTKSQVEAIYDALRVVIEDINLEAKDNG